MNAIKSFEALKPMQKIFLVIALATIFCSIFTDCFLCRFWPLSFSAHWRNPLEGFDDAQETLYIFTAKWCSHCRTFQSEIDKLATLYANDPKIKFQQVDAESNEQLSKAANVTGYPTVALNKAGQWITYTGQRESSAIKAWADSQ